MEIHQGVDGEPFHASIQTEGKRKSTEPPVEEDKTVELAAPYSIGAGGSRISHKLKKATGSAAGGRTPEISGERWKPRLGSRRFISHKGSRE